MKGLRKYLSAAVRLLAILPLHLAGRRLRTELVAGLADGMVTEVEIQGRRLMFFTPNPLLVRRAKELLSKEPDMIDWLERIQSEDVLWDIGANAGVFTLYAGVVRAANVLAFEPSAANFHVLTRNIQLNHLGPRVTAFCLAFADKSQLGILNMASPEMGASMSQFGRAGEASRYWEDATISVMQGSVGFTIDEFIDRFRPPFPNYLKIDVDGLEWPILLGARQTLSDGRLRSAMIELSVSNKEERQGAIDFLKQCGLSLKCSGAIQGTGAHEASNHLFERVS